MHNSLVHPKRRGEWAELQFAARAASHGFKVSKPWGDSSPYDIILEKEGRFVRIQVKSTMHRVRNSYICKCHCSRKTGRYKKNELDFMAFYIIPLDLWYILPAERARRLKTAIILNPYLSDQKYKDFMEAWYLLDVFCNTITKKQISAERQLLSQSVKLNTSMGRIHVLSEQVANQIAAGEVVERPASVVKELLENSLDAGATRIKVSVEAGGKKLIQITDNGTGMVRDDAMLAFERHATSKIRNADDLVHISTLGFRGEGLPSIAAVSRLVLETNASGQDQTSTGTRIEFSGGKMFKVEEAGVPAGTSITIRDLFFNVPARRKFLKAESTELSHIASLVTHYALAHPDKHFELHNMASALLMAPPVKSHQERIYQIFGKETLDQLLPIAAETKLERAGLPEPPPWRRAEDYKAPEPGTLRVHGFISKPEFQKLNRTSIYVFVNNRLIHDRVIQHALTEAYRNLMPPTVFPVVLLFLEMPSEEVDCNVHPAKVEVRFRQQAFIHDFVRDSVRNVLMKARPVAGFEREILAQATAGAALSPPRGFVQGEAQEGSAVAEFSLSAPLPPPISGNLQFSGAIDVTANAATNGIQMDRSAPGSLHEASTINTRLATPGADILVSGGDRCAGVIDETDAPADLTSLATLKPLGQLRESFILAVNHEGMWIIDQHVAHERVLFEKILREREVETKLGQHLLMPLIIELTPAQMAVFGGIAEELTRNGFEAEPFGARSLAVKSAPAGVDAAAIENMLSELFSQIDREERSEDLDRVRHRIAASIACHAAIKINMPLTMEKMEWLLRELALTDFPVSCPHGRPIVLRYSVKDIQKAFKRI